MPIRVPLLRTADKACFVGARPSAIRSFAAVAVKNLGSDQGQGDNGLGGLMGALQGLGSNGDGGGGGALSSLASSLGSQEGGGGLLGGLSSLGSAPSGGGALLDGLASLTSGGPATTPSSDTSGVMLEAARAQALDPVAWTWIEVPDEDLEVFVPNDAFKATLGETPHVRVGVSYADLKEMCRLLTCVPATKAIVDAVYLAAKVRPKPVGLVRTAQDSQRMRTVAFSLQHHREVERQLAAQASTMGLTALGSEVLIEPVGKWSILDPKMATSKYGAHAAVNYGWFQTSVRDPIQTVGGAHDDAHADYSQVARAVHRYARRASTHESVDLLDAYAEHWPELGPFLEVFR